jgi:KDO2-lipid IV(A) lauroyltransferase
MSFIAYLLFLIFLYPLSYLPLEVLYFLSNILFFLVFYVFRYRRKIVRGNLERSFPEKSSIELDLIERAFYFHLCGLVAESFKAFNISREELLRRVTFENPEYVNSLYEQGKSVVVLMGHSGSWEWAGLAVPMLVKFNCFAIYHDLEQPYLNKLIKKSRSRFGINMLSAFVAKSFYTIEHEKPFLYALIADQTPSNSLTAYWSKFLQQDTSFYAGPERSIRQLNCAVVYVDVLKPKRGHYVIHAYPLCEDPSKLAPGEITEQYIRLLETSIRKNPEHWLWSHNRWKRPKPEPTPIAQFVAEELKDK